MFGITSFFTLALAASSAVGFVIPGSHRSINRRFYASNGDILEDYDTYHSRYLNLNCENQHNTAFFDHCCHPFLKTQGENFLPADCVAPASSAAPAAASTAAAAPTAASTSDAAVPTAASTADAAAPTASSSGDDGDDSSSTVTVDATSTAYAAPTASSSADAAPTDAAPTASSSADAAPTDAAPSASSSADQAAPTDSSSNAGGDPNAGSSSSDVITGGVATFFYQNGVAGACGTVHADSDFVAAMDSARYGTAYPSPLCGQQVVITNTKNGKSVTVTVADECPTCINGNSIDLSTGAFNQIADEATGEVPITWHMA